MKVNKVVYAGNTILDLSEDTLVSPEQLVEGVVAHGANGNVIIGTLDVAASNVDEELATQATLIANIQAALENKVAVTDVFASIGVTYPIGSTCTCTNGTEVLVAKNTNGRWVFAIPSLGEWTVTSTANDSSGSSKSEIVNITAAGQTTSVELSYGYYLFNNGSVVEWVGYKDSNGSAYAISETLYLKMASGNGNTIFRASLGTKDKISTANYTKLCAEVSTASGSDIRLALSTAASNSAAGQYDSSHVKYQKITGTGVVSVDISDYNGSYHIMIVRPECYSKSESTCTVTRVWLE